ncbi:TerD family protein [Pseudoalteromonas sp. OFAV1]|jgi:tellurium resistance protein TerD|uniref:TerD family protein n=1 Tax=Pseudoalteromonas sp. OFAV1 TaxID=2908892 RepID=UPI001F3C4BC5|nr:TerD family protein [Pseudoalteromonas sp. OFAV1]MCF2903197.1 TerD family protein [Pseudoalteromonas sp. OFAV1]
MAISLSKGQGISLTKENPQLNSILVGLGWEQRKTDGDAYDLDASAFLLDESGKVYQQPGIVGYVDGCETGANGAIVYSGDNQTGEGDGDDEHLTLMLSDIPEAIKKVVFTVTIHKADERGQNFGGVEDSFIRVVNQDNNEELCKYDLREDFDTETSMILGELYRHDGGWKFRAIGEGFNDGLAGLCNTFGVQVK